MVGNHDSSGKADSHDNSRRSGSASRDLQTHLRAKREEFEQNVAKTREQFEEVNDRINARTGRNLIVAILIGIVLVGLVAGTLLFQKQLFVIVTLAGVLLGVWELTRALQAGGKHVDVVPQLVVAAAIVLAAYFADPWFLWVLLFTGIAVIAVWRMVAQMSARDGRTYGDVLSDILVSAFLPVYVPLLAALAMLLLRQDGGEWWVAMFIVVAVAADTGAYAIGLWLGKHPLAPRVSPKKTWEGFGGAVAAALIVAVLMFMFVLQLPWWTGIIAGLLIVTVATVGDLGESLIKRDLGIKDMSSWIPGHGGLLDRLDSVLPSAAAGLALYSLFTALGVA